MNRTIQALYENRNSFVIVGLTGGIGSGCTTTAKELSSDINMPPVEELFKNKEEVQHHSEYWRHKNISDFYDKKRWLKFISIHTSDVLFLIMCHFLLPKKGVEESSINDAFSKYIDTSEKMFSLAGEDPIEFNKKLKKLKSISNVFVKYFVKKDQYYKKIENGKIVSFIEDGPEFLRSFVEKHVVGKNSYVKALQLAGNSIRINGSLTDEDGVLIGGFEERGILIIPELVRRIMRAIHEYRKKKNEVSYFVVDAFRNPYEIEYFRSRYSSFYLFSVLASGEVREKRVVTPEAGMSSEQ